MNKEETIKISNSLQTQFTNNAIQLCTYSDVFKSMIWPTINKYKKVFKFEYLDTNAAFRHDEASGQVVFNMHGIERFWTSIPSSDLNTSIRQALQKTAIEQYVTHELVHIGQGLADFQDIQAIKQLGTMQNLAEFDVIADIYTSNILSSLELNKEMLKTDEMYHRQFLYQLIFMGSYAFPAFGAPVDKMHKVQRCLSLSMTAARINTFLQEPYDILVPLDNPIFTCFDLDSGKMLVFTLSPTRGLLVGECQVDQELLLVTCSEIDSPDFTTTLSRVIEIFYQIGEF